jgi:hypothetical protein
MGRPTSLGMSPQRAGAAHAPAGVIPVAGLSIASDRAQHSATVHVGVEERPWLGFFQCDGNVETRQSGKVAVLRRGFVNTASRDGDVDTAQTENKVPINQIGPVVQDIILIFSARAFLV